MAVHRPLVLLFSPATEAELEILRKVSEDLHCCAGVPPQDSDLGLSVTCRAGWHGGWLQRIPLSGCHGLGELLDLADDELRR